MSRNTGRSPSQERRPQGAVELISTPLRLLILITLLITAGGVAWSCLARIPVYVNGVSYLLDLGDVDALPTQTEGAIYYQFSASTLIAKPLYKRLYQLIKSPEAIGNKEITKLAREILLTSTIGPKLSVNSPYAGLIPEGQVLAWIDSPQDRNNLQAKFLAFDQSQREFINMQREGKKLSNRIDAKITILRKQLSAESSYLKGIESLLRDGFASKANVLSQRTRVDAIEAEILTQQQELITTSQKVLEAQAAQQEALLSLRKELNNYVGRSFLFAERPLFIVDIVAPQASRVREQDNVLNVSAEAPRRLPDHIPGYLSQSDAEQVSRGMEILVTPVGMDRTQFGGIIGTVADVAPLPSSADQIAERTGSTAVAQQISSMIPDPVRVDLVLQRNPQDHEPNHSGFRWSSPGKPPFGLSPGNQLSLQITTQRVQPISLLIPSLLRLSGASPPNIPPQRLHRVHHPSSGEAP